jgi:hypothetical protein
MAGQTSNYDFDYPTSTDYVKDGATAIQELADDVDATLFTALGGAYPGLRLVKKQTIGTGVSSVTVTDAFSATYENYKIVVSGGAASIGDRNFNLKLGASTSGYNYVLMYGAYANTSVNSQPLQNGSAFNYMGAGNGSDGLSMNCDVINPFLAKWTTVRADLHGASISGMITGIHKSATSYTDFTLTTNEGTWTGGTIYVYGYGAR